MFTVPPFAVATITGVLLPLLVGLVTKAQAPARVKVVANLVASALAGLLLNALNDAGVAVLSVEGVATWLQQTVISVATYLGVWKPLDVPARLAPSRGVGHVEP